MTLRREGLAPRHGAAHLDPRAEAINGALPASLATTVAVKDSPAASVGGDRTLDGGSLAEALPAPIALSRVAPAVAAHLREQRGSGLVTTCSEIELAPLMMMREPSVASTSSSMDSAPAASTSAAAGSGPAPAASAARLSAAKHRFVLARGGPSMDDDAASEGAPDIESDEQMAARLVRHVRTRSLDTLPSVAGSRLVPDSHRAGLYHHHHQQNGQPLMSGEGLRRTVRHGGPAAAAQASTSAAPAADDAGQAGTVASTSNAVAPKLTATD